MKGAKDKKNDAALKQKDKNLKAKKNVEILYLKKKTLTKETPKFNTNGINEKKKEKKRHTFI